MLVEGSPILALRRWSEKMATRRDRPDATTYAAVTVKAMNFWREGRVVGLIGWRAGGTAAEPFPLLNL